MRLKLLRVNTDFDKKKSLLQKGISLHLEINKLIDETSTS